MKKLVLVALTLIMAITFTCVCFASDAVIYESKSVGISTGNKTVNMITADLNNGKVDYFPVLADNKYLSANTLKNVAEQHRTSDTVNLAAINGYYFDAYSGTNQAYGVSQRNGEYFHMGGYNIAMGFDADNNVMMEDISCEIEIYATSPSGKEFDFIDRKSVV